MIKTCPHCGSDKVRKSATYKDMWICKSCGKGDYIGNTQLQLGGGHLDIKVIADNSLNIADYVPESKKVLIITDASESEYTAVLKRPQFIFYSEIKPGSYEYQSVLESKRGIFIFHESSPEILITEDFKSLAFDRIIIHQSSAHQQWETIKALKQMYIFCNGDNNLKTTELFILEEKRKSKYRT